MSTAAHDPKGPWARSLLDSQSLDSALTTRGGSRDNNFLALRLLAALAVVVGHSFPMAPAACATCMDPLRAIGFPVPMHGSGVLVFFVISGFLILRSAEQNTPAAFFRSRFLRVLPGLSVCALLMAFVLGPIYSELRVGVYLGDAAPYAYVGRIVAFFRHPAFELPGVTFTSGRYGTSINGSLWTIPLEVRLYVLAALVLLLRRTLRVPLALGLAALIMLTATVDMTWIVPDEDGYRLAWAFAAGSAMYILRRWIPLHWGLCIVLLAAWLSCRETPAGPALLMGLIAYVTLYLAFLPRIRIPAAIEDYSFGIYLYAYPMQQVIAHAFPASGPYALMAMSLPLAWFAGHASWKWVEQPALRLKARGAKPRNYPCPPP